MAQRFGGKFSPDGKTNSASAPPAPSATKRGSFRVKLLFIAPLPLIWQAFGNGANALVLNLIALGLLLLAAWLTRDGILAQAAYNARKIARRPALPRKIFGSLLTGLGLTVAGMASTNSLIAPILTGLVGAILHSLAFGLDPLKSKGVEGMDSFQSNRAAAAIDKAETRLAAMSDAISRSGDRTAQGRVAQFQTTVRVMLRAIQDDPRDLTAARKYLSVYLSGARDATIKFADINTRAPDDTARQNYLQLLTDLEENFTAKTAKLLENNQADLEIEIDVLRDRLSREGIRLK
ncbi:hypothetical protein MNBD_ALPHA07-1025 [hydrothermal vent metagenome]|uniref:5-bromo-4-chloroindolyl phosphate hydrolysis protein n=1 Tax=hydrothermal vent metagenome TaxID=652676 RepID=A0A3B0RWQ5_9ZZZZ